MQEPIADLLAARRSADDEMLSDARFTAGQLLWKATQGRALGDLTAGRIRTPSRGS